jgi:transcriptional regulator with XRE-family HTH domain
VVVAEPNTFAARLTELREKAGLSQYKLAQLSGVSKQTISQLEKGEGDPSWDTVKKLAHALGVSIDEFDTDDEGEQEPEKTEEKPTPKKPAPKKKPKPKK